MLPIGVATVFADFGRGRLAGIALQPQFDAVMVKLLAPQQPGQGLPLHPSLVVVQIGALNGGVEGVGLGDALLEDGVEVAERICVLCIREAHLHTEGFTRRDDGLEVRRDLRPDLRRIHPLRAPVDNSLVDSVLDVGRGIGRAEQALGVGLVLGEQQRRIAVHVPPPRAQMAFLHGDGSRPGGAQFRALAAIAPRPRVAIPQVRQDVEGRGFRPAIDRRDATEDVLLSGFGVLDDDIEITARREGLAQRVRQLELRFFAAPGAVLGDQLLVREGDLGVFVEHLHIGMGGRVIQVEIVFLHVLAVVALVAIESKEAAL